MVIPLLWRRIVSYWTKLNLPIRAGVTPEQIAEFEQKYQVVLPADLSEFLQTVDGTGQEESDEYLTSFLSLSEIVPVHEWLDDSRGVVHPDRFAYPDCFVFIDYCLSAWAYAVRITSDPADPGPVYRVMEGGSRGQLEARSFREFMIKYASDPQSIIDVSLRIRPPRVD